MENQEKKRRMVRIFLSVSETPTQYVVVATKSQEYLSHF